MSAEIAFRTNNPEQVRQILAEPNTVFLVLATHYAAWKDELQGIYDRATQVAIANNQQVWRILWIEMPRAMTRELSELFWKQSPDALAVVLSMGTALARTVKASYRPGELFDETAIFGAFTEG